MCLNSLSSGWSTRRSAHDDRRPGEFVVALGTVHQPDENGPVAHNEGRDAEDGVIVHGGILLPTETLERPAGIELGEDRVVVDA